MLTLHPYLSSSENRCYSNCLNLQNLFTLTSTKKCVDTCTTTYPNYGENKICIKGYSSFQDTQIIDHDGKCVSSYDITSIYNFNDNGECKESYQTTGKVKFSKNNYVCKAINAEDNKYLAETMFFGM